MAQEFFPPQFKDQIEQNQFQINRLQVIGGWIVCIRDLNLSGFQTIFISDPRHEWQYET